MPEGLTKKENEGEQQAPHLIAGGFRFQTEEKAVETLPSGFFAKTRDKIERLQKAEEPVAPLSIGPGLEYLKEVFGKSPWDLYEYIRGEVKHEHNLLSARVAWYITCQSFLLTVYDLSYTNSRGPNWFSNLLLPCLAISVSILAYYMIAGATQTIGMWASLREALISAHPRLDPILIERWRSTKRHRDDKIHIRAMWFPRVITGLFIFTWFLIGLVSWLKPWITSFPLGSH